MQVQHKNSGNRGLFFVAGDEGTRVGELIYTLQPPNRLIIEHTEVANELRGQNIGFELVQAAVRHARTQGQTLVPVCPFAKAVLDEKPDFQDVLD